MSSSAPIPFGKYVLLDRLAVGGMAEVFRGKLTGAKQFERLFAIKCLKPELALDDQFTAMFVDEAKLAAQLTHANIVQIFELGTEEGRLFIVMELIEGRDLRAVLKACNARKMSLPSAVAAYVIARAAEGLDFAHRKTGKDGRPMNLVHRDVSPQNILVSFEGEVKVVDFGIAKARRRTTETLTGTLKGNLSHMAPEQAWGQAVDRRADIFGLGTVLYELLTGHKLFVADDDLALIERVRNVDATQIRAELHGFPPEFEPMLQKALARDPQNRFDNAHELTEALAPMLIDGQTIIGTKNAAEFMQRLFAPEIETMQRKQRADAERDSWNEPTVQRPIRPAVLEEARASVEPTVAQSPMWQEPTNPSLGGERAREPTDPRLAAGITRQAREPTQPAIKLGPRGTMPVDKALLAALPGGIPPDLKRRRWFSLWSVVIGLVVGGAILLTVGPYSWSQLTHDLKLAMKDEPEPAEDDGTAGGKFGFLSLQVTGVEKARVWVGARDAGFSPVEGFRVRVGQHRIKIVPYKGGKPAGPEKLIDVTIAAKHTKSSPAVFKVPM